MRLVVLIALTSCVVWWVAYRGEQALQTGERAQRLGNRAEAVAHYKEAAPWDAEPYRRLAMLYEDKMSRVEAAREACALEPTNANNQLLFARVYMDLGQWTLAEGRYREATELDPHKLAAWNELAQLRLEHGQLRRAQDAWKRITEIEQSPYNTVPATPERPDLPAVRAYATAHYWLGVLAAPSARGSVTLYQGSIPHLLGTAREISTERKLAINQFATTIKIIEQYDLKLCAQVAGVAFRLGKKLECQKNHRRAWRQFAKRLMKSSGEWQEIFDQLGYRSREDEALVGLCFRAAERLSDEIKTNHAIWATYQAGMRIVDESGFDSSEQWKVMEREDQLLRLPR